MKLTMPCEFWLFGDNVQKQGVVTSIPTFACNSGTSITVMLDTLHQWMSNCYNKQVCILTDGEDQYDEPGFTAKFNQLRNRNHSVTVYDICHTNVEPLKRIFSNFSVNVATTLEEINKLMDKINNTIAHDRDLLQGITKVETNVQQLIVNYQQIELISAQLKGITERITKESQNVLTNAEQAIIDKSKPKLTAASDQLKNHINDIADHIKKLKDNDRKIKRCEADMEEADEDIEQVQTKIDAETNSPNPNHQQIASFRLQIQDHKQKKVSIENKIKDLKRDSASSVRDFELLRSNTVATQTRVTNTLQTVT